MAPSLPRAGPARHERRAQVGRRQKTALQPPEDAPRVVPQARTASLRQAAPPARSLHGAAVEQKQAPGARGHHEHEDRERQGEGVPLRRPEPLAPDEDHPGPVDACLVQPERRPQRHMIAIKPGEGLGGRLKRD